jgi:protein TonB
MRQASKDLDAESKSGAVISGWLNECLIDGDPAAIRSARRARRKAVSLSLALQAGLLATALIVPLFAHVVVPRPEKFTPIPPYARGGGATEPQRPLVKHAAQSHPVENNRGTDTIYQPPGIPLVVGTPGDSSARTDDLPNVGPGDPRGIPRGLIESAGPSNPAGRPPILAPPNTQSPKPANERLRISEPIQQAMLIYRVEPRYPPLALQIRLEGTVRLHAIVGRDGVVRDLELLSGHALLAPAALDALRQWRYRPTILNGEPVEVETYITVIFQLRH